MSNQANFLEKTAERLGITDENVCKKSKEYLRGLTNKASIKNLNDIAKIVMCLDLACKTQGEAFDKETAVKLSGLRKTVYQNNLNVVEKVLDLDKQLTVPELCVQFSCTIAKETAINILTAYANRDNKIKDLTHPQYVAAAVYIACKIKGISVNKQQFVGVSRLKAAQWKELTSELEKFVDGLGMISTKKRGQTEAPKIIETNEVSNQEVQKKKEIEEEEVEDYDVWKCRILREAYMALGREQPD